MLNASPKTLPPRANLRHLKTQAKDLMKALASRDREAAKRVKNHLPKQALASIDEILTSKLSLQESQLVIAREYGFPTWPQLKEYIELIERQRGKRDLDRDYARKVQYRDDGNLNARIALHSRYTPLEFNMNHILWSMYQFKDSDRILDVGCGNGQFWQKPYSKLPNNLSLTLLDTIPGMLQAASDNLKSSNLAVETVQGEAERLDFRNESFDFINCAYVMHLVSDAHKAIQEFYRVLKHSGQATVTCIEPDNMDRIAKLLDAIQPQLALSAIFERLSNSDATEAAARSIFDRVETRPYRYQMKADDPELVLAYAQSTARAQTSNLPSDFWHKAKTQIESDIAHQGYFSIHKSARIIHCYKP